MNFTREPIIETVITPREGCKLVIRSSKGKDQEDYFVDAVEVVSFGHSFFFRSTERPKSFLVPVSDYEVLELKETRMILKNVSTERSIKIGGGREAPPRPAREYTPTEPTQEDTSEPAPENRQPQQQQDSRGKRDRRRRGRRGRDRHDGPPQQQRPPVDEQQQPRAPEEAAPAQEAPAEVKAPSFISKLFPPPSMLIKETLSRYKPAEPVSEKPAATEETIFEHPTPPTEEPEDDV